MTFLYAVPNETNNTVDLDKSKLGYAFDGLPQRGLLRNCFDAENVALLADRTVPIDRMRHSPDLQTWRKAGPFYIGYWNDSLPTEESLKRPTRLQGKTIELCGQTWTVPQAVTFHETPEGIRFEHVLSRYLDINEEGELIYGDVEAEFEPLLDVALKWYQFDDHKFEGDAEYFQGACTIMGFNYRVSAAEMTTLKLLTKDSARKIIELSADDAGYEILVSKEESKKKAKEDSTMSDGETESIATTSPQLQTS